MRTTCVRAGFLTSSAARTAAGRRDVSIRSAPAVCRTRRFSVLINTDPFAVVLRFRGLARPPTGKAGQAGQDRQVVVSRRYSIAHDARGSTLTSRGIDPPGGIVGKTP